VQIVAYQQQANVVGEKNIMLGTKHPFILSLVSTFKDANCLYMLLELVQGGELFTYLRNLPTNKVRSGDVRGVTSENCRQSRAVRAVPSEW
jgi:cGMP-dependent protein kinase